MYTFSLMIGFGAAVGLAWSAWLSPGRLTRQVLDGGLAALVGGLIGGRLGEVVLDWAYYRQNLGELLQLQHGGLVWPGALLGALLVLGLYAAWMRQPFGLLADNLLPLLACCSCAIWLGCWSEGCAYGYPLLPPIGLPAVDESGELALRFPLQLLGALLSLLTLWAVQTLARLRAAPAKRRRVGESAWLGLALFSAGWLALSLLRASPAPMVAGFPWDTWAALSIFLFALVLLLAPILLARFRSHERDKNHPGAHNSVEFTDSKEQVL